MNGELQHHETYDIRVIEQAEQNVLSVHACLNIADLPALAPAAFGSIFAYLQETGEAPAGPPFTAYHNTDLQALEVELGFPVTRPLPARGDIRPGVLAAGRVAACTYMGTNATAFDPAYFALVGWMQENELRPGGTVYDVYLDNPAEVPADRLRSEIRIPLV